MPGKVLLIKKPTTTTHYDAHHQAAAPNPCSLLKILLRYDHEKKMWLAIGPAQRAAEKAAKAKELELLEAKEQEAAEVLVNGFKEAAKDHHQAPYSSDYVYSLSSSSFESKLNATKRKLHDSYQQLANAKKQRKIQVIDQRDLPPTQPSSSRGAAARSKATVVAARKKMMITTNKKTMNNNNLFDVRGGRSKLMKPPTSIS